MKQIYTDFSNVFFMFSHNSVLLMFIFGQNVQFYIKGKYLTRILKREAVIC